MTKKQAEVGFRHEKLRAIEDCERFSLAGSHWKPVFELA